MRTLIYVTPALLLLGCSTSPCQHLANTGATLATKVQPCAQAGGSSIPLPQVNVNQCGLACSTIEQTAIDETATCLDAAPTCDPSDLQAFTAAVSPCATDLQNLSTNCLASLAFGSAPASDGGNNADAGSSADGGGSTTGNVSGEIDGASFKQVDAISGLDEVTTNTSEQFLVIEITNRAGICPIAAAGDRPGNSTTLVLLLEVTTNEGTTAPTPGVYTVSSSFGTGGTSPNSQVALVELSTLTAQCGGAGDMMATSGTVTLTQTPTTAGSAVAATGSLSVTFGAIGSVSGSFNAAPCMINTDTQSGACE